MAREISAQRLAFTGIAVGLVCTAAMLQACGGDDTSGGSTDGGSDATTDVTKPDAGDGGGAADTSSDAPPDSGCAAPQTACGATCVDLTTDPSHCGACDHSCGNAGTCSDGICGNAVRALSAGELVACALRYDGTVWCWGSNQYGELGSVPTGGAGGCGAGIECNKIPQQIAGISDAVQVSVGTEYACAVKNDGSVWCWGKNDRGQLGHDPAADSPGCAIAGNPNATVPCKATPTQVALPAGVRAAQVAAGWVAACVRTQGTALDGGVFAGDVYCWGDNTHDEVGLYNDAGLVIPTPNKISGINGNAVDLHAALGGRNACVVLQDGTVWCWGGNFAGRLGIPEGSGPDCQTSAGKVCNPIPVQVHVQAPAPDDAGADAGDIGLGAPLTNARNVRAGSGTTCITKTDDTVWCWGDDGWALLADNGPFDTRAQHPGARQIPGLQLKTIDLRYITAYGTDGVGDVWTWGQNTFGQSGNGSNATGVTCPINSDGGVCTDPPAKTAGLSGLKQVAAGVSFAVGLKSDGSIVAWGRNGQAQLGHDPMTTGDVACGEYVADPGFPYSDLGPCNATPKPVTLP